MKHAESCLRAYKKQSVDRKQHPVLRTQIVEFMCVWCRLEMKSPGSIKQQTVNLQTCKPSTRVPANAHKDRTLGLVRVRGSLLSGKSSANTKAFFGLPCGTSPS